MRSITKRQKVKKTYTPPDNELLWMARAMTMDREWRFYQTPRGQRLALTMCDGTVAAVAVRQNAGLGLV